MLSVGRIAHAGIVVETARVRCLMDPGLVPEMAGMYHLNPPIQVDRRKLKSKPWDAVIISHHHGDHFCLKSLDLLQRDTLVVYPRDFPFIEALLARMGFNRFKGIAPWEELAIGDLTIIPTPSEADFPEMGMIFLSGKHSFWNVVDTEASDATIRRARRRVGKFDLMFCYYQLLIEWQVYRNALGCDFNLERHEKQLMDVVKTDPRCYVPSSCGWLDKFEPWRNLRQYQMSEPQFMADMKKLRPKLRGIRLAPGERIDIHRGFKVTRGGVDFVRPAGRRRYAFYDWRPDAGIPPLTDPNPTGYRSAELKRQVKRYLEGDFLRTVNGRGASELVRRWKRDRILWRLELVYPDRSRESRLFAFRPGRATWIPYEEECFPQLHTTAAASVIPDLLNAEVTPTQAMRLMRRVHRQYTVTPRGVRNTEVGGSPVEADPLAEALFFGTAERALLRQVIRLGY